MTTMTEQTADVPVRKTISVNASPRGRSRCSPRNSTRGGREPITSGRRR
jgi:hypothetical protein